MDARRLRQSVAGFKKISLPPVKPARRKTPPKPSKFPRFCRIPAAIASGPSQPIINTSVKLMAMSANPVIGATVANGVAYVMNSYKGNIVQAIQLTPPRRELAGIHVPQRGVLDARPMRLRSLVRLSLEALASDVGEREGLQIARIRQPLGTLIGPTGQLPVVYAAAP